MEEYKSAHIIFLTLSAFYKYYILYPFQQQLQNNHSKTNLNLFKDSMDYQCFILIKI